MDHNIFISYAWVDNEIFPGTDKGWVSTFVDGLRNNLARELGRKDEARLWMDYEQMRGNQSVTSTILARLKASHTLVLILSNGYLASRWCRQELATFIDKVGTGSGCIFVVQMSPVQQEPKELCDLLKYPFYYLDEKHQPRTRWYPLEDPTDREYYDQQQTLARDLAVKLCELQQPEKQRLNVLPKASTPVPDVIPRIPPDTFVLIDGGVDDQGLVYDIAKQLEQHDLDVALPLSVLPNQPGIKSSTLTRDLRTKLKLCSAVLMVYRDGPVDQVSQHLIECLKVCTKTQKDHPTPSIHVCQTQSDPLTLGLHSKGIRIHVIDETCADDCVKWFVDGLSP